MSRPARVFLYGTLRNLPHLAAVLGRSPDAPDAAVLPGYAVRAEPRTLIPVIVAEAGARTNGLVLDAGTEDLARLDFYELPFGYTRGTAVAETPQGREEVAVYWPDDPGRAGDEPWSLTDWQNAWGALALDAAIEMMGGFGTLDPGDAARAYPSMLRRAWSRRIAAGLAAPATERAGPERSRVEAVTARRAHTGFFALDDLTLRHPTFAGGMQEVRRDTFLGFDAALVLPYDPRRELVLMVEQFRAGAHARGDKRPWLLEPVAGLIDPGETPENCARRETLEEARLDVGRIVPVMHGYASPGASTEYYHLFVGLCDLDPGTHGARDAGLDDEGEDIRTHVLPLSRALSLVESGEANVVPLATLLFWVAANRGRLRTLA